MISDSIFKVLFTHPVDPLPVDTKTPLPLYGTKSLLSAFNLKLVA